jgi:DNA replication and repair protein RecF
MGFTSVRFFNFRNLADRDLDLGAKEVFLIGENGQGKTNLIEVIYLLCVASSFRESRDLPFFRDPGSDVGLFGRYAGAVSDTRSLSVRIAPEKRKEIRLDEKLVSDRRELFENIHCICFVQQDMDFVDGPPEAKRRFFDQTSILSDPCFLDTLRKYRRVLLSRNFALKTRRTDLLEVYDAQLAPLGLEICARRARLAESFNRVFTPLISEISGWKKQVAIAYVPSWTSSWTPDEVLDLLMSRRARDLALGTTTTGPHRDSFRFTIGGGDFLPFASTGQMRLCALLLRVAQARFLTERTGKRPILLLDDVLLELDHNKRVSFLSLFPPYEQAFFTFLPDENFAPYRRDETLVLNVQNGEFTS